MIEDISNKICEVIKTEWPKQLPVKGINLNTKIFYEDIGLDSVDGVTLILGLEEKFEIEFDKMEISPDVFETIGSLSCFIEKQINEQRAC